MPLNPDAKTAINRRLAKLAGQVRGLQDMIQTERDALDILTQVAAARGALDAMGVAIVEAQMAETLATIDAPSEATIERARRACLALQRFIG